MQLIMQDDLPATSYEQGDIMALFIGRRAQREGESERVSSKEGSRERKIAKWNKQTIIKRCMATKNCVNNSRVWHCAKRPTQLMFLDAQHRASGW